jgi:ABC-type cobalamin transport system ATPase subunit
MPNHRRLAWIVDNLYIIMPARCGKVKMLCRMAGRLSVSDGLPRFLKSPIAFTMAHYSKNT